VPTPSQFSLLFALLLSPLALGQTALRHKSAATGAPLEVKLAKPLSWHDHRLEITIKRVNHSKSRILLAPTPFQGVEIYSSVIQAPNTQELGGREAWILVYGWSDVIYP
jgi:hypothetical protein